MAETTPEMTPQQNAWQGVMDALNTLKDAIKELQTQLGSDTAQAEQSSIEENEQVSEGATPDNTAESSENENATKAPAQDLPVEEPVVEEPAKKDTSEDTNNENEIPNDLMAALVNHYGNEEDIPKEVIKVIKEHSPKEESDNSKESADKSNNGNGEQLNDNADENSNNQEGDDTTNGEDKGEEPANDITAGMPGEFKQLFQFLQIFLELVKSFTQIIGAFINNQQALADAANHIVEPQEEQKTEESKTNESKQAEEPAPTEPTPTPTPKPTETPTPTAEPSVEKPAAAKPVVTPTPNPTLAPAEPTPAPEPTTEAPTTPTEPAPDILLTGTYGQYIVSGSGKEIRTPTGETLTRDDRGIWRNGDKVVDFTGENGLFNQCPDLRNHITSQTNEDGSVTMFGTPNKPTDVMFEFKDNMLSKIKVGSSEYVGDGQGGFYGPSTSDGPINVTAIMDRHDVADRIKTGIDNSGVTNPSTPMVGPSSVINAVMNANQR